MRAYAASETLLVVHLWHGREHRLIAGNFGIAIDETAATANVPEELRGLAWTAVLSTDDTRFGGRLGHVDNCRAEARSEPLGRTLTLDINIRTRRYTRCP